MGPLAGLKVVEFATVGPVPMCAMLLADAGASVVRIERPDAVELGTKRPLKCDVLRRGRPSLVLDLKAPGDLEVVRQVIASSDALIEGYRPGVMEKLGLGPDECLARTPRLVYGRMTGWGQDGPLAQSAAHDLNYVAITGALAAIGQKGQPPAIPLNLLGDFGGGALYLAFGVMSALYEAARSGRGQVVDAAIVDGVLSLLSMQFGALAAGMWKLERGANVIDSGAPFYNVYQCADGRWVSVAPIEMRFFRQLLAHLDIDEAGVGDRLDRDNWPRVEALLKARFLQRTQAQWCELLEGTDSCFAPVLDMAEAQRHPQLAARGAFVEVDGVVQPAPAPRYSRTPNAKPTAPQPALDAAGQAETLRAWLGPQCFAALQATQARATP